MVDRARRRLLIVTLLALGAVGCASAPIRDITPPVRVVEARIEPIAEAEATRDETDPAPPLRLVRCRLHPPPDEEVRSVRVDLEGGHFVLPHSGGWRWLRGAGRFALFLGWQYVLVRMAGEFAAALIPFPDPGAPPGRAHRYATRRSWSSERLLPVGAGELELSEVVVPDGGGPVTVRVTVRTRLAGGGRRKVTLEIRIRPPGADLELADHGDRWKSGPAAGDGVPGPQYRKVPDLLSGCHGNGPGYWQKSFSGKLFRLALFTHTAS